MAVGSSTVRGARRPTLRQRRGARAERLAAAYLERAGWHIIARGVRVGRDELDLIALDPGPPAMLVAVEVRSVAGGRFGAPEERTDARKVARIYRAMGAVRRLGCLPDGRRLPRCAWRVDLVAVEDRPVLARGVGGPLLRHLVAIEPF